MTILNAIVKADQVLLSIDSAAAFPGGEKSITTKIFSLPHLRAVIAGTGTIELAPVLQTSLLNVPDFDAALVALPRLLSEIFSKIKILGRGQILERQAIFITGWSVSSGRFVARWAQQDHESKGFQITALGDGGADWVLSPWEGEYPPAPATRGDLVELARRQFKIWKAKSPDAAFGGELIVAELTKNAVRLDAVWDLSADRPLSEQKE